MVLGVPILKHFRVNREFKQLKIGFGALTVKSHIFWALLYSSHNDMDIEEH